MALGSTITAPGASRTVGGAARAALGGLVVAIVALTTVVADPRPAAAWTEGACTDPGGVTVVVDFQELGGGVNVRCAPGPVGSGFDALSRAGISYQTTVRFAGFLCRIAGKPANDPCVDTSPASAYWSYWLGSRGGQWCYSDLGAGNRRPPAGTVEGWSFSLDRTTGGAPAPRTPVPAPIPGVAPAPLGAGDCDSGVPRQGPVQTVPAPPAPPPPPPPPGPGGSAVGAPAAGSPTPGGGGSPGSGATPPPGGAAGQPGSPAAPAAPGDVGAARGEEPLPGEPTGDPEAGTTALVEGATTAPDDGSTALDDAEAAGVDLGDDGRGGGSVVAVVVVVAAVAALAIGGGLVARRRRTAGATPAGAVDDAP